MTASRLERPIVRSATSYLLVFIGGGIGAAARQGVNVAFTRWLGTNFPFNTLFANVSGSVLMGLLAGYYMKAGAPQHLRLFLTTGVLGGYTTFSTFSLDAALLYERDQFMLAAIYVLASVVLSIAGLFAGLAVVRHFT